MARIQKAHEIADALHGLRNTEAGRAMTEYLNSDYERLKEQLVTDNSEIIRGMAQKVKSLLKIMSDRVD